MANNPALFEEGEPLNVDKLNDLVTATTTNTGTINSISNSTTSIGKTLAKGFPVIEGGQIDMPLTGAAKANKFGKQSITLNNIQSGELQTIVATVFSAINATETITCTVRGTYPTFTIYVTGSPTWNDTATKVNWMALGYRATV